MIYYERFCDKMSQNRFNIKTATNMKKLIAFISICVAIIACRDSKSDYAIADLSQNISVLKPKEILYSFDDAWPASVAIKDSLIYIIKVQSDTCISVLNMNTKTILCNFGIVGHGPNDIISPDFISTVDNASIFIEDTPTQNIMTIERDVNNEAFILNKYIDYPNKIYPSGETNLSEHFIVGRRIRVGKMLYIYNRITESIKEVDYYPIIKELKHDPNYIYAPTLALNESKNRIIAGMYLFDMFHVYDLDGNRLKTIAFSDVSIPSFDSKDMMADIQKCKAGITRSFSTRDYCYLLRIIGDRIIDDLQFMIIKVDWDGNVVKTYRINEKIEGQFYVDESSDKLYAIRHIILDQQELFEIALYQL